jgi:hypothetical protein
MGLLPWKEYIEHNILRFREYYDLLTKEEKRFILESKNARLLSLNKPTQVIVIDPADIPAKYILVMHAQEFMDMDIFVYENMPVEELCKKVIEHRGRWLDFLPEKDINSIFGFLGRGSQSYSNHLVSVWTSECSFSIHSDFDFRSDRDYLFDLSRRTISQESELTKRKAQIEKTVIDLKKDAEAIPEEIDLRSKIIKGTTELEDQIKELQKRLDTEVGGVRQLIGTSERFLDWKAFTTDVEHLKTTHIAKETFHSEIKRIDEKIDKSFEALNTRIEDLKAIKFWSKRTLLEIALAIWGAIVTLYAAGIIKF